MSLEVIYCALRCASALAGRPHETLRRLDRGTVEALPHETLRAVLAVEPEISLLYFSRSDYDLAVRGLHPREVDEALRLRLRSFAPRAWGLSFSRVAKEEQRSLTLTARAWRQTMPPTEKVWATKLDASLDLLTMLAGPPADTSVREALTAVVESEMHLVVELDGDAEATTRTAHAKVLAHEIERLGMPQFAEALPFVEPMRGVWMHPEDDGLKAGHGCDSPPMKWRGGVVAQMSPREMERAAQRGKKLDVLYYGASLPGDDGAEITTAQLHQRLEALVEASPAQRARQKEDMLVGLRLTIALQRHALRSRVAQDDPLARTLDAQAVTEALSLRDHLASSDAWLAVGDEPGARTQLALSDEELTYDARTLASLLRAWKQPDLAEALARVLRRKAEPR